MNADQLKASMDCRDVVRGILGEPKFKSSDNYAYCCPFHAGKKPSFTVWQDGWKCWADCQESGDVISFIMKYHGLTFSQAVAHLGGQPVLQMLRTPKVQQQEAQPPPRAWQELAIEVLVQSHDELWETPEGHRALSYLWKRGLTDETIHEAKIGYIPWRTQDDLKYGRVINPDWLKADGKPVRIPCGILIPHYSKDALWGIRVRRSYGDAKYLGIAGGKSALYWNKHVCQGLPVLIDEGEFNALIIWQEARDLVSPVALASASNASLNIRWWKFLMGAPVLLARMDDDSAGAKALEQLRTLTPIKAAIIPEMGGKDPNDLYRAVGRYGLRQWIEEALK